MTAEREYLLRQYYVAQQKCLLALKRREEAPTATNINIFTDAENYMLLAFDRYVGQVVKESK